MRSLQLQAALTEYLELAAAHLHAEVLAGAEVPFELEQHSRRRRSSGPSLYCYRPLTEQFIAERMPALERLPGYAEVAGLMASFDGLGRYLTATGAELRRGSPRAEAGAAISALLCDVFTEQSDFELIPARLSVALARLDSAALSSKSEVTLVATLQGLTITSPELALTKGLTIAQPHALDGLPPGVASATDANEGGHLVVVLAAEEDEPRDALARGREILRDLLRALRLFGDGRVTLGVLAWARIGDGPWSPLALGSGGRPHGMLVVTSEQEDELRAFCNLVSRRAPDGNELAWALRRFELGCERADPYEALSDNLLALRALLEPEGTASARLPGRLAALCAMPEHRLDLSERVTQALALEHAVMAGTAVAHTGAETLALEVADHLRALLRDVICGHLDDDLVTLAEEILREQEPPAQPQPADPLGPLVAMEHETAAPVHAARTGALAKEIFGDPGEAQEVLDVFI